LIYYLNIGSNLGNRRDNLHCAVVVLGAAALDGQVSQVVESEPWGFDSDRPFLNVGMMLSSDLQPQQMLDHIHDVERMLGSEAHRDAAGHYVDRLVDIDIMAVDEQVIHTPVLQVPHPHLPEREFFLKPMKDLNPRWRHPVLHLTATEMLQRLQYRNGQHELHLKDGKK